MQHNAEFIDLLLSILISHDASSGNHDFRKIDEILIIFSARLEY